MPDISLCSDPGQCAYCDRCKLNPAVTQPADWQSWSTPRVRDGECADFWEVER
jgi:hypothetical protein